MFAHSTTGDGRTQGRKRGKGRRAPSPPSLRPHGHLAARSSGGKAGGVVKEGLRRGRWGFARAAPMERREGEVTFLTLSQVCSLSMGSFSGELWSFIVRFIYDISHPKKGQKWL